MTTPSKRKGDAFELEMNKLLNALGVPSERVGAQPGRDDAYDLLVRFDGGEYRAECKRRRDGFKESYGWLENSDWLLKRSDRKSALIEMRLETFLEILGKLNA